MREIKDLCLDLSKIDQKEFRISSDPDKGLHLVCPKKNKWEWSADEKWLRSIVVNNEGRVVSCSFPKFGNYGEFPDDTRRLNQALADKGRVLFSHKEDGSLCVRSVVNGEVILRTRGTLFGGDDMDDGTPSFGSRFRKTAEEKYPILLDPTWYADDVTLLFEYVAPDNRVVVGYKEPDLVFLGGVDHAGPKFYLLDWPVVSSIAEQYGLNLVQVHELPDDPQLMLEEVRDWRSEGIVARCADGQVLVKVKSAYYLANHRMKFSMTYKTIVEFVKTAQVEDEKDLAEKLKSYDYDWEVVDEAKRLYARYQRAVDQADAWAIEAARLAGETDLRAVQTLAARHGELVTAGDPRHRKEFARVAGSQVPMVRTMMFLLYDRRYERLANLRERLIANECKTKK